MRITTKHPNYYRTRLRSKRLGASYATPEVREFDSVTVLRAVSGNSRDGACFTRQTNMAKKAIVHRRRFLKIYSSKFCDIWQNFDFYRVINNENFKMKVEQTNFVIHLIITTQLYYWLSENPSVKIWSNKFQMVMIN